MGLLDELISTGLGVVESVPIVGPIAGGVVRTVTEPVVGLVEGVAGQIPLVGGLLGPSEGGGGGDFLQGLLGGPGGAFGSTGGDAAAMQGFSRGNGTFTSRTIIETLNLATGGVTREVRPGRPHIMNSDVQIARRVIRQSRKLAQRIPKKTVKESKTKQLTDAAVEAAMRNVQCPPDGGKSC